MRLAAICFLTGAVFANVAFAQENPTTSGAAPLSSTAWPAPVGHRQPRKSDLPPDVIQRETQPGETVTGQKRQSDSRLTICRGC
jgi:hypothetical protein